MSAAPTLRERMDRVVRAYDRPSEREFLPAALEVLETPPSPTGRTLMALIALFFVVAVLWAAFGKVDVLATAPGQIRPASDVKVIQPLDPGIVRAIDVADGDRVKAGQLLIALDPTQTSADRDRVAADLMQAKLDVARLTAAATGRASAFVAPEGVPDIEVAKTRAALAAQLAQQNATVADIGQQIGQKRAEGAQVAAEAEKLQSSIPMLARKEDIHRELTRQGYGTSLSYLDAQQQLSDARHEVDVNHERGAQASSARLALERQRDVASARFRADVLTDLAKAESKRNELEQELLKATDKSSASELRAPIDGWVQDLSIHTVGGVVTPAQRLLTVAPEGGALIVEAQLANRDVGFVRAGQRVKVKIETFSFTRYGLVDGTVIGVSAAAVSAQDRAARANEADRADAGSAAPQGAAGSPTYAARIKLDRTEMQVDGRREPLRAGMAITAEIRTGSRTVLDYLFSPLARRSQESLHER